MSALYDLNLRAHLIVAQFLTSSGYQDTAEQFRQDALKAGVELPVTNGDEKAAAHDPGLDLKTLVETYNSTLQATQQRKLKASREATHASRSMVDPLTLTLPGPSSLPFRLESTHKFLHASNILSIERLLLPKRQFDTSADPPRYRNTLTSCLVTTAADKRIVFSDPVSGQAEEILQDEGPGSLGHSAAVLAAAQDPMNPQCLVSAGMDSRVVVWDLLSRKPVQQLGHHSKFVVRLAFSPTGDYLASAGYDRKIVIYRRVLDRASLSHGFKDNSMRAEEGKDDDEPSALPSDCFEKAFELETKSNPEAILFVRADAEPSSDDIVEDVAPIGDEIVVKEARHKRTWLAFTVRNDCFLHYVALPRAADQGAEEEEGMQKLSQGLHGIELDANGTKQNEAEDENKTADWSLKSFNTNANAADLHVSYSLLSLSLHPSGLFVCAQTGDHTLPNMSSSSGSNTAALSRLLLLPMLSSRRASTIWTGVPTSSYATPRHSWLPSGRGCWLNAEDGVLRLVDLKGKTRAQVLTHGLSEVGEGASEAQRAAGWSRGGNTIVKDVVALSENKVASCGFDRTVRVLTLEDGIL